MPNSTDNTPEKNKLSTEGSNKNTDSSKIAKAKVEDKTKKKEKYKLRNWSAYNQSLKNRGKISIWLSDELEDEWYYTGEKSRGGQKIYSDLCMELCLTVKSLYSLPYRQTEGFLEDLFSLLDSKLIVPSYTQMQRRSSSIDVHIRTRTTSGVKTEETGEGTGGSDGAISNVEGAGVLDIVIDSTGLKVYGEGRVEST